MKLLLIKKMLEKNVPSIWPGYGNKEVLEEMSLAEHLQELRRSILILLGAGLLSFTLIFSLYAEKLLVYFLRPLEGRGLSLVYLALGDALGARFTVSLMASFIFLLPLIFYELWSFLQPALYKKEKIFLAKLLPFFLLLFVGGVAFGFFVVFASVVSFLIFQNDGIATTNLSVNMYLSFLLSFVLPFGLAFEMPVCCYFLHEIGLLKAKYLQRFRKFAILFIFIISALLTPPDVLSQIMMALPLWVLYEGSIFLIRD